ncbi:MAG: tetratricopeptide repeat protein [Candidatus Zixiibacteriota bacterium]|nr:MAG: tetratricopeptide repeat protein [candidate division Zixibacteria bacterium]
MIRTLLLLSVILLTGCSQSLYLQGRRLTEQGEYDRAIAILYDEIRVNPQSADAWRELGVAFYKKGDLTKAEDALKQANHIRPDSRTSLFSGMIHERQHTYDLAIQSYTTALNLEPDRGTRNLVRAHLDQLIEKKFREEALAVVAGEAQIKVDTIPQNTVAVVNFDGSNLPPKLAPLGLGLAEFTAIDLAKVNSLRVVDRMKIDIILQEMKLGRSEYVDRSTAPRIGRMLGSRRIVTGSLLSVGANAIRLDGAVVNTADSRAQVTEPTEGDMRQFFRVQKEFVFKVIDEMGIELTAAERDSILQIPTESYLAFMAYCRGLDFRSRGMPQAAAREFQQAASEDRNFGEAGRQAGSLSAALSAAGPGGEYSLDDFEGDMDTRAGGAGDDRELAGRITTVIDNSGVIPDSDIYRVPIDQPIVSRNGTVIIRGTFDVEN